MVNNFKCTFILREGRKSKQGIPVYCRIKLNNTYSEFSTNIRIEKKNWNKDFKRITKRHYQSAYTNTVLDDIEQSITKLYHDLVINGTILLNAHALRDRYLGRDEEIKGLVQLTKRFIEDKNDELAEGSLKNYRYSKRYISSFIKKEYKNSDYPLTSLSLKFVTLFEKYLKKQTACHHNGAMKHIQRLKAIINYGIKLELLTHNPVSTFKVSFERTMIKYLDKHELKILESKVLKSERLAKARDMFLFACYTGLSYIEVKQLRKENIKLGVDNNLWICTHRQKTGAIEDVPLLPKAKEILSAYSSDENTCLLPIYCNQVMNRYLKELAQLCNIAKEISYHSGRDTFATTIALENGVPLETLQKVMGHSSIVSTLVYGKIVNLKVANDFKHLL